MKVIVFICDKDAFNVRIYNPYIKYLADSSSSLV